MVKEKRLRKSASVQEKDNMNQISRQGFRWTNKYNLPASLFEAITYDLYHKEGEFSITELIKPPQILQLELRHASEIEVDVSDGLWRLLGQAVHVVLERIKEVNRLKEERLKIEVDCSDMSEEPIVVSGGIDLYEESEGGMVSDWKVTSVWSFLLGDKPEWTSQLNCYAQLYREHNFAVKKARINAILRDWQKSRIERDKNYPMIPFVKVDVPLWDREAVMAFLSSRIGLHLRSEETEDRQLEPCTKEEMWEREATWAVMKPGRKTALRVFPTEEMAKGFCDTAASCLIEKRPGKRVRCEDGYCNAAPFCFQFKRYINPND